MSSAGWLCSPIHLRLCALVALLAGCASGPVGGIKSSTRSDATELAPCPTRPSCVVSRDDAGAHAVDALSFYGPSQNAMARLTDILSKMPRTRVITSNENYVHATAESRWLRFTDDVEFLLNPQSSRIEVRSCSRLGYYDFGVNRARVEAIRAALKPPQ